MSAGGLALAPIAVARGYDRSWLGWLPFMWHNLSRACRGSRPRLWWRRYRGAADDRRGRLSHIRQRAPTFSGHTLAHRARAIAAVVAASLTASPAVAEDRPVKTEHFLVSAEAGATNAQAEAVSRLAERAFDRVTGDLGYVPEERIVILAYQKPEGPMWDTAPRAALGLVQSPQNVIRIALGRSRDELYQVVAHEIAHVVLARALRSDLEEVPRWFNEGLAMWVSRIWTPDDEAQAQDLAAGGHTLPPDQLDAKFVSANDQDVRDAYVQSASMVEALTRIGGVEAIARLVKVLRHGPDFDTALRDTTGVTQDQLYSRWLAASGGRGRWPRWLGVSSDIGSYVLTTLLCIAIGITIWRRRRCRNQQQDDEEGLTQEEIERAHEIEAHYDPEDEKSL